MDHTVRSRQLTIVILGDIITLLIITLVGFGSHGALSSAGWRLLSTFIPLTAAWGISSIGVGTYEQETLCKVNKLWRPFLAMVLAGPLAGVLRGFWLDQPVIPLFTVVLGGFSAIAIVVWRYIYVRVFVTNGDQNG